MDVTRGNFEASLSKLTEALASKGLEFISVDVEMTGINLAGVGFRDTNATRDTPAERYAKMRPVATAFGIVQLGVTAWRSCSSPDDEGSVLRASTFNFYVFPGEQAEDMSISPAAMRFLSNNGMNWDLWLNQGIAYDTQGAPQLRKLADESSLVDLRNPADQEFFARQVSEIKAFSRRVGRDPSRFPTTAAEVLLEGHESNLVRRALHQHVERNYPELKTETRRPANAIAVVAKSPGIRRVYQMLSEACRDRAVPIVGHNCLYDFMFCMRHLDCALPESYAEWKRRLAATFPHLYDTKAMAARCAGVEKSDLSSMYSYALKDMSKTDHPSERKAFRCEFEHGFDKYGGPCAKQSIAQEEARDGLRSKRATEAAEDGEIDDDEEEGAAEGEEGGMKLEYAAFLEAANTPASANKFHEAGWDSYTTGVVFASLRAQIQGRGLGLPKNRLHLMRSPFEIEARTVAPQGPVAAVEFAEPLGWTADASVCLLRLTWQRPTNRRVRMDEISAALQNAGLAARKIAYLADDNSEFLIDVAGGGHQALLDNPKVFAKLAPGAECEVLPFERWQSERVQRDFDLTTPKTEEQGAPAKAPISWWRWLTSSTFTLQRPFCFSHDAFKYSADTTEEPPRKRKRPSA